MWLNLRLFALAQGQQQQKPKMQGTYQQLSSSGA